MICENNSLFSQQIVFPFFHTLHQCIQLLVICRISNHNTIKSFRMKTNGITMLQQECFHGIVTCICLYLKWLYQIKKCKNWILSFNASKYFCFLPPHWKNCLMLVIACNGAEIEEKLAIQFIQYWVASKNLLTFVTLLGLGHSNMTLTLEG